MENGCLSPRSAAAHQASSDGSAPTPMAYPAHIPAPGVTGHGDPSHVQPLSRDDIVEPSLSLSHSKGPWPSAAEDQPDAVQHSIQQQLMLEQLQLQQTMEHHRRQLELEKQEQLHHHHHSPPSLRGGQAVVTQPQHTYEDQSPRAQLPPPDYPVRHVGGMWIGKGPPRRAATSWVAPVHWAGVACMCLGRHATDVLGSSALRSWW